MRLPAIRWAELVSAHHASGLSLEQFARRHQVNPKSLGWWRARLRREGRVPAFVEVRVKPLAGLVAAPLSAPAPVLRLELPAAGVGIDVPPGVDLAWLRQVVWALS